MRNTRKHLTMLLRLLVAFGIIAYLLTRRQMDLSRFGEVLVEAFRYWPWLLGAVMAFFSCMWIGVIRWKLILDAQSIRLPMRRIFAIFFIGHFFNAFMMGSTGGDVVKAMYVAKEAHHRKTEAVLTVAVDRLMGLIALFVLAGTMMAWRAPFFLAHPRTHPFCALMVILILVTGGGLLLMFHQNLFERVALFRRAEERLSFGPVLRRAYDCVYLCRTRPRLLLRGFSLSLVNHLLAVLGCYWIGRSLQITNPFIDYLTLFPTVLAVASLPITPGGLGTREATAVVMLSAAGIASAQALPLSLLAYIVTLGWSLFGGVIFLFYSASSGEAFRGKLEEIKAEISSAREEQREADSGHRPSLARPPGLTPPPGPESDAIAGAVPDREPP